MLLDLFSTILFALLLVVARFVVRRMIVARQDLPPEVRRRWQVTLRNSILLTFLLGLVFIWGHEIRTLAVSLVAIAAAIVLATKELILCLIGGVYRTSSRVFDIGDVVEIGSTRGKVVDRNLLSTTLLVSGSTAAGRLATIPNSLLLNQPVFNDALFGDYTLQLITIPLPMGADWQRAEALLLAAGEAECAPYLSHVSDHAAHVERHRALDVPSVAPRVRLKLPDHEHMELQLQVPLPINGRLSAEQRILHAFMSAWQAPSAKAPLAS